MNSMHTTTFLNHQPKSDFLPDHLLIQWHITDYCNLKCSHCYQDNQNYLSISMSQFFDTVRQCTNLISVFQKKRGMPLSRVQCTLTGGEPFEHPHFFEMLSHLRKEKPGWEIGILTNGTLITREKAKTLSELSISYVQVSIDGSEPTHNAIRGSGSWQNAVEGLRILVTSKIQSQISFTASALNYKEFPLVAKLGRRLGVNMVWADRLVPLGNAAKETMLSPEQTQELFFSMLNERKKSRLSPTRIPMHRALQFIYSGREPYRCSAGRSLVTIMPSGDIYPCRRMPMLAGNLYKTPLEEIYFQSDCFRELQECHVECDGCEKCFYSVVCHGGLKCLSKAISGSPFGGDPGCLRNLKNRLIKSKIEGSLFNDIEKEITCSIM